MFYRQLGSLSARSINLVTKQFTLSPLATLSNRSFSKTAAPLSLFTKYVEKLRPQIKEISVQDLVAKIEQNSDFYAKKSSLEPFYLLDVRETTEWNGDHIPAAEYTGRGTLERDIEGVVQDPTDMVVLYCAGGVRSVLAAHSLKEMGYTNVYSLKGGMRAWKQAGLPVVRNNRVFADAVAYN